MQNSLGFLFAQKNTILLRFVHFFKKCGKIGGFQWERPARSRYGVPYIDRFWCTCSSTSVCASLSCRSQKRLCSKSTQKPAKIQFCRVLHAFRENVAKSADFDGIVPADLGVMSHMPVNFGVSVQPIYLRHHRHVARRSAFATNPGKDAAKTRFCRVLHIFSRKRGKIGGFRLECPDWVQCCILYSNEFGRIFLISPPAHHRHVIRRNTYAANPGKKRCKKHSFAAFCAISHECGKIDGFRWNHAGQFPGVASYYEFCFFPSLSACTSPPYRSQKYLCRKFVRNSPILQQNVSFLRHNRAICPAIIARRRPGRTMKRVAKIVQSGKSARSRHLTNRHVRLSQQFLRAANA